MTAGKIWGNYMSTRDSCFSPKDLGPKEGMHQCCFEVGRNANDKPLCLGCRGICSPKDGGFYKSI